ncbi:MAG: hypothetical protein M1814_003824 [Vezdaea aestivalis]|nr:MAG: hypothetical protein M1814_003824 [Vezdaea aestivalis]
MEFVKLGNSGLKVSKIILGTMSYGTPEWEGWVLDEEKSLPLLKAAFDHGINTWDTADTYSNGESERIICKALKKYEIPREQVVIMSKCFSPVSYSTKDKAPNVESLFQMQTAPEWQNRTGLSRKHIFDAVEASVKRLGTYIDVLQIHRLDDTPAEEIMKALNDVIEKGWVRYIGASSMYAWQFQKLQYTAEKNGWPKFISMQNYYNLLYREEEREMLPLCKDLGVTSIPWSPVARGVLTKPWDSGDKGRESKDPFLSTLIRGQANNADEVIVRRVEEIAKKRSVGMACVATAWVLSKGSLPIIGIGKAERIPQAVEAVSFKLTDEEVKYLEEPYSPRTIIGHW